MYAVVKTGGKQYRVQQGDVIEVEKITLAKANQKTYKFDEILLLNDGKKTYVGAPTVKNAEVEAKILGEGKAEKIIVYKYKSKKDYRRKQGHRQPFTRLEISKIGFKTEKAEKAADENVAEEKPKAAKTTEAKTTAATKAKAEPKAKAEAKPKAEPKEKAEAKPKAAPKAKKEEAKEE